ncbi:MAG: hypothetical protein ACXWUR_03465, partial [Allosphingosinicella sp.]
MKSLYETAAASASAFVGGLISPPEGKTRKTNEKHDRPGRRSASRSIAAPGRAPPLRLAGLRRSRDCDAP